MIMSTLYLVATPIGNLKDVTLRALETLKEVDVILAEDTRTSKKFLKAYQIEKQLLSFHQHSSNTAYQKVIDILTQGKNVALITDAGTPGISDPGGRLVEAVAQHFNGQVRVIPIPGPSALTAALSICGFSADHFVFFGFVPHKKKRHKILQAIADNKVTSIFFESPHRIIKTLTGLVELLAPDRQLVVARELTKQFETVYRGVAREVLTAVAADKIKGEYVIVVDKI